MSFLAVFLMMLSILLVAIAIAQMTYIKRFAANSTLTVAHVCRMTPGRRKGRYVPMVEFRNGKRFVHAEAMVFDKTSLQLGQKVNIRYLDAGTAKRRWDVRILGANGYGRVRVLHISIFLFTIAAMLAVAAMLIFTLSIS